MHMNITKEVAALARMTVRELQGRYAQAFGEATQTNNKPWLVKRIAWRLQAMAEGDLSERARQRAAELANDADLRLSPPKVPSTAPAPDRTKTMVMHKNGNPRIPMPGTIITRLYKGRTVEVKVLPHGFEHEGEVYRSLSAVAKFITGSHCNGYHFFRLAKETER
jgi:hypothetical protein